MKALIYAVDLFMIPRTDILTDVRQKNAYPCNFFGGIKNWCEPKPSIQESKLTCLDRLMSSFAFWLQMYPFVYLNE